MDTRGPHAPRRRRHALGPGASSAQKALFACREFLG
jgi:hypothetical protein